MRHSSRINIKNLLLFSVFFSLFIFACGKKEDKNTVKVKVKAILTAVPQSDSWSGKFDIISVTGKLEGSKRKVAGSQKTRFKFEKKISIKDERGSGVSTIQEDLKPGNWIISLRYKRDGSLLGLNKGVGKSTVTLSSGKLEKIFFMYDAKKGFTVVDEEVAKKEEKDFFLNKQDKFKDRTPPPEPEPDYEAEGY